MDMAAGEESTSEDDFKPMACHISWTELINMFAEPKYMVAGIPQHHIPNLARPQAQTILLEPARSQCGLFHVLFLPEKRADNVDS